MTIQPLNDRVPIINADGTPTNYFIRMLQERGITVGEKITAEEAEALIEEWSAGRDINVTAPITGGGSLDNDVTIGLAASGVTPGSYTSADITVDAFGRVTLAANGSGGGGGHMTLLSQWSFAADGAIQFRDVNVTGIDEVLVIVQDVTLSVAQWRTLKFSSDGGATFDTTAGRYQAIASSGGIAVAGDVNLFMHSTSSGAARSCFADIKNLSKAAPTYFNTVREANLGMYTQSVVVNAIRVGTVTDAADFTGGAFWVYGR